MEDLELCVWKILSEDKNSTTFEPVHEGHELYACYSCIGTKEDGCSNYHSYNELKKD